MHTAARVAIATGLFAAVHSALASDAVKEAVAARVPFGRELYRVAYNAQAVAAFGGLVWYIARQPSRTIYHARGPLAAALRVGQLGGIAFAVAAARATGIATLLGVDNLLAVLRGTERKPVPAAQGPEADERGELRARGPFRIVRHPLNLAPIAPFWLTPHMTSRRLGFNVIATAYLVIGSLHEEARLRRKYGERYDDYRRQVDSFYLPPITTAAASRG